jgi:hypothetical protein
VGIGGVLGMVFGLMLLHGAQLRTLPLLLVLAGALGSARLLVTDHTPAQVYTGAALGFAGTFLCLLYGVFY